MIEALKLDCPALIAPKPIVERNIEREMCIHLMRCQKRSCVHSHYVAPVRRSLDLIKEKIREKEVEVFASEDCISALQGILCYLLQLS